MQRVVSGLIWGVGCAVAVVVAAVALSYLASIGDPSSGGIGIALIFMGVPLGLIGGGIYGAFFRKPKEAKA